MNFVDSVKPKENIVVMTGRKTIVKTYDAKNYERNLAVCEGISIIQSQFIAGILKQLYDSKRSYYLHITHVDLSTQSVLFNNCFGQVTIEFVPSEFNNVLTLLSNITSIEGLTLYYKHYDVEEFPLHAFDACTILRDFDNITYIQIKNSPDANDIILPDNWIRYNSDAGPVLQYQP